MKLSSDSLEKFESLLTTFGVPLDPLGIQDVGLFRRHTLKAVAILRLGKLAILGGHADPVEVWAAPFDKLRVTKM